jgi:hypothetical protein
MPVTGEDEGILNFFSKVFTPSLDGLKMAGVARWIDAYTLEIVTRYAGGTPLKEPRTIKAETVLTVS